MRAGREFGGTARHFLREPIHALIQTVAGQCAARLNVPRVSFDRTQRQVLSDLHTHALQQSALSKRLADRRTEPLTDLNR